MVAYHPSAARKAAAGEDLGLIDAVAAALHYAGQMS